MLSSSRPELTALALVLLLVLAQLMWPPIVGLASNGDFERMMKWGGLEYVTQDYNEKYFAWINREFRFAHSAWRAWRGFPSSEAIFVKLGAIVGDWLLPSDRFDLRIIGIVHLLGFLAAFWLLLRGWRAATQLSPLWLLPGFLLLFCDLGYTAYFHSFYSEPASLIFLLAMVGAGLYLTAQPDLGTLTVFCLCAGLFIAAKPQNFALVPALLLFCARLWFLRRERAWRGLLAVFALTLVAAAVLLNLIAPHYRDATRYHSVFYGILKDSPTPEQDLRALGLDERFAALANTTTFHQNLPLDINSPEFRADFLDRINHFKVLRFYLTHPHRLLEKLRLTAERGYTLRLEYAGNYEKASGRPAHSKAYRWSWWSSFKQEHWPKSLWLLAGYCLLLVGLLLKGYRRAASSGGLLREFGLSLWLMLLAAFVTPIIGDGESDLTKHLFLFNALFDLSLLFLTAYLAARLWRARAGKIPMSRALI